MDWLGADGMVLINALLGLFAAYLLIRMRAVESRHKGHKEAVAVEEVG